MSTGFRAPIWFFLARRHGLAYLQVPKVACTSLRIGLCLLNRPELKAAEITPSSIHQKPELNDRVAGDDAVAKKFFRFTFVRDPLARFASFYRNKIADVSPEGTEPRFIKLGLRGGMPLEEVVDRVLAAPRSELDPHLVPQSYLIFRNGKSRVDFIGKLEQFAADRAMVENRAGVTLPLPHVNPSQGGQVNARAFLGPTLSARLRELYQDDFALLGYEP